MLLAATTNVRQGWDTNNPRFRTPERWYTRHMPWWLLLLTLPAALLIPSGLLMLSAAAERRILSPQSLILSTAKARRSTPELTEALVAREFERLLKDTQRR